MVELQDVLVAHRHLAVERLARTSVMQGHLAGAVEPGALEMLDDVRLAGTIEHRRCDRHTGLELLTQRHEFVVGQGQRSLILSIDIDHGLAQGVGLAALVELLKSVVDDAAQATAGPAQMRLEDLSDVHARGHAQRVQHHVDLRAVLEIRHVLEGHDLRHDTLVAVPAGHLVARLDLALHGDEDLDHLHHAGRQLVAALQLVDLVHEAPLEALLGVFVLLADGFHFRHGGFVGEADLPPLAAGHLGEHLLVDDGALARVLGTLCGFLADEGLLEARIDVAVEDLQFVVAVLGETLDLLALDGHRPLVLVDAVTIEDAHLDDGAVDARRQAQRRVAHVGGLLAEDCAQQLLFRRHRAFALRRDLADEDVAGVDLRTDEDDAGLVEVLQSLFGDVGDVARDFFGAELGIAGHDLELLDVDRGEDVIEHDALGEQDAVLEIVAHPRHERDEHVLAEGQIAEVGRGTVRDDLAGPHRVTHRHQRTLVDAGVLVRALELAQAVDVDAGLGRIRLFRRTDDDTSRVHLVDDAGAARRDGGT